MDIKAIKDRKTMARRLIAGATPGGAKPAAAKRGGVRGAPIGPRRAEEEQEAALPSLSGAFVSGSTEHATRILVFGADHVERSLLRNWINASAAVLSAGVVPPPPILTAEARLKAEPFIDSQAMEKIEKFRDGPGHYIFGGREAVVFLVCVPGGAEGAAVDPEIVAEFTAIMRAGETVETAIGHTLAMVEQIGVDRPAPIFVHR